MNPRSHPALNLLRAEADTARPLLMSQVVPFYKRGCPTCPPTKDKQGGTYVRHVPPRKPGQQHQTQLLVCGCAHKRFMKAHAGHIIRSGGQWFWRRDYVPSGAATKAPPQNAEPHADPLAQQPAAEG